MASRLCARFILDRPVATPDPEALAGRVTEFVRNGDTVRRPATESSKSVQQLLTHLDQVGFDGASRFRGAEPDGSVVPSRVEVWTPAAVECWRLGRGELATGGELLRSDRDRVAGLAPGTGFEEGPQEVCDVGPRARRVAVRPCLRRCQPVAGWLAEPARPVGVHFGAGGRLPAGRRAGR